MDITESRLENSIIENGNLNGLAGFEELIILDNQVNVDGYFIDLLCLGTIENHNFLVPIELKKGTGKLKHLGQLMHYIELLNRYIIYYNEEYEFDNGGITDVVGILIAKDFNNKLITLSTSVHQKNIHFIKYKMKVNFEELDYSASESYYLGEEGEKYKENIKNLIEKHKSGD